MDTTTVKRPAKVEPKKAAVAAYAAAGWQVMIMPTGIINDIIAQKGNKLHFCQVVVNAADAKYQGLPKNTFIQNAFSNGAIPVHAMVAPADASGLIKIVFTDANLNTRVVVAAPKVAVKK